MPTRKAYILHSVNNALRVLEAFSVEEPELGISELTRRLGLGRSSVYRLVATLKSRRYLDQDPATGKFRLGLQCFNLGATFINGLDIRQRVRPYLVQLVAETGETGHLVILEGDEIIYLDKVESRRPFSLSTRVGWKTAPHSTAAGKVLLAFLPSARLEEILPAKVPRFTANTITDRDELKKHLDEIRLAGYAVDHGENQVGVACVAAPVKNEKGDVVAAISVSGPAGRVLPRVKELALNVMEKAHYGSQAMGYLSIDLDDRD